MRCDYICGHVRCRECRTVARAAGAEIPLADIGKLQIVDGIIHRVKVYFLCCNCKKLRPLSRTGDRRNNRTKPSKPKRDKRKQIIAQIAILQQKIPGLDQRFEKCKSNSHSKKPST